MCIHVNTQFINTAIADQMLHCGDCTVTAGPPSMPCTEYTCTLHFKSKMFVIEKIENTENMININH